MKTHHCALQRNDFCDLLGAPDAPVSKLASVKGHFWSVARVVHKVECVSGNLNLYGLAFSKIIEWEPLKYKLAVQILYTVYLRASPRTTDTQSEPFFKYPKSGHTGRISFFYFRVFFKFFVILSAQFFQCVSLVWFDFALLGHFFCKMLRLFQLHSNFYLG